MIGFLGSQWEVMDDGALMANPWMTLWTKSQITLSVCIINLESAFDRPTPQVGSNERGEQCREVF